REKKADETENQNCEKPQERRQQHGVVSSARSDGAGRKFRSIGSSLIRSCQTSIGFRAFRSAILEAKDMSLSVYQPVEERLFLEACDSILAGLRHLGDAEVSRDPDSVRNTIVSRSLA